MGIIKLGSIVRDVDTGFTGKVTGHCNYLHEVDKYMIEAVDTTGRPIEWWAVANKLEVVEEGK